MKLVETRLPGVLVIEPRVFEDARGYFFESYNKEQLKKAGLDVDFVQSNVSRSRHGTLRGLHYQWPHPQGKLVSVTEGEVFDVAVDIRPDSATFGQWEGVMLSATNHRHLWIPEGFAHGFCVVSDAATFTYQCTSLYDASADRAIRWNDAFVAVDWPISSPLLSLKDMAAPLLNEVPAHQLPTSIP